MNENNLRLVLENAIAGVSLAASELREASGVYKNKRRAYDVAYAREFLRAKQGKRDDGKTHTDEEAKQIAISILSDLHGDTKAAEIVFETAKLILRSRQDELSGYQTRVRMEIEADRVEAQTR